MKPLHNKTWVYLCMCVEFSLYGLLIYTFFSFMWNYIVSYTMRITTDSTQCPMPCAADLLFAKRSYFLRAWNISKCWHPALVCCLTTPCTKCVYIFDMLFCVYDLQVCLHYIQVYEWCTFQGGSALKRKGHRCKQVWILNMSAWPSELSRDNSGSSPFRELPFVSYVNLDQWRMM